MPDILIRGMKMPENCIDCPCMVDKYGGDNCCLQSEEANEKIESWDDMKAGCPLHELPEHGDLILKDDAIVAVKLLSDLYPEYRKILAVLWDQIKDLTVIIPESEEVTNDPKT